jgi:cyclophilin family peptidyl-prolyl cis-trans isomerase
MTLASLPSLARRLATVGFVASLAAGCSAPTNEPTPTPTPMTTIAPTVPPYILAPTPFDCPTSAPALMHSGETATVTMTTNFGVIVIKVEGILGPNAAGAFTALSRCGYYNNVMFHRIAAKFVIQGGDGTYARLPDYVPEKMGTGGPSWTITDDPVNTTYKRGTMAIARTSEANSGNSQFFIVLDDSAAEQLAAEGYNNYAIFGNVTSGMDVVDRIAQIPVGGDPAQVGADPDMALQPAVILSTVVTVP